MVRMAKVAIIVFLSMAWAQDVEPELLENMDLLLNMEVLESEEGTTNLDIFENQEIEENANEN